jgi:GPH family glycoside/pentoside/hexuronide:cation symporter
MAIGAVWVSLPSLIGSATLWVIYQLAKGEVWSAGLPAMNLGFWKFPGLTFFTLRFPDLGSEVTAARVVALVCGIIILLFGLGPTLFIRERFQHYNSKHVSLWRAVVATLHNRAFVLVVLLRFAETLGSSLYSSISFFIGAYYICGGNRAEYTAFNNIGGALTGFLVNLLIWPLAVPLTRRLGKRWGLILGMGVQLLWAVTVPLVTRPGWIWIWFAHITFLLPFFSMKGMFLSAIMPDICDIDELESGERREGLYAAVLSFISKLEVSLCTLIGGYFLYWAGFDARAASKGIQPTVDVMHNLLWLGFVPLIFFCAVAFVITCLLPLTPKTMAAVHAALEARRAACAARA